MNHKEMFQAALRRPKNYFKLSPRQQWCIDEELGILDWDGPKTDEEKQAIYAHHGFRVPKKEDDKVTRSNSMAKNFEALYGKPKEG